MRLSCQTFLLLFCAAAATAVAAAQMQSGVRPPLLQQGWSKFCKCGIFVFRQFCFSGPGEITPAAAGVGSKFCKCWVFCFQRVFVFFEQPPLKEFCHHLCSRAFWETLWRSSSTQKVKKKSPPLQFCQTCRRRRVSCMCGLVCGCVGVWVELIMK